MAIFLFLMYLIFSFLVLYHAWYAVAWEVGSAVYLITATFIVGMPWWVAIPLWGVVLAVAAILRLEECRQVIADFLYQKVRKSIPKLSKTEEEALNAGDTWVEKNIFTGTPDWDQLAQINTTLSAEEQAFLSNEVNTLCGMLDEWAIIQENDLPVEIWEYIKKSGFFGLVIDKKYGGKSFSARAHSDVVLKIASRSVTAAVTVMVPNSLGPGELLQLYGTEEQKEYYLPRLAQGIEVPCFALTEPGAGSDATSLESEAIVVQKTLEGKSILGLMLTLNKRWITLSPVATLIGLAVNLKDPDGLLKGIGQEGITCVLIPRDTEGLEIGNRHLPASQPFMNGTIRGHHLFVPINNIIGGQERAGGGWQMLVECLSIGRSISLPALATASASISYLTTSAFATIRRQFKVELAQFEGVEEKLAEIGGLNYLINATRLLTLAAVNEHKKPSVASAITKYFNTELARIAVNNAMDIHAGRTVVVGPRNYLANLYQSLPISITVEGANIMSRNLLIFGQGSMACHPFIREEFYAISKEDKEQFNQLIWHHIHYFMRNLAKTICTAWTGGVFISVPASPLKRSYKKLTRLSYAYAWLADLALIYLGGALKRKERLSARLADGLSYLYMAKAVLRYTQDKLADPDQLIHAQWALTYCFSKAQHAMLLFSLNFPARWIGFLIRLVAFPLGQTMRAPTDRLDHALVQSMIKNNPCREELKQFIYLSGDPKEPIDKVEHAFQLLLKNRPLYQKVNDLRHVKWNALQATLEDYVQQGTLTQKEMFALLETEKARWDAIQVDEFSFDSMRKKTFSSLTHSIKTPLDKSGVC